MPACGALNHRDAAPKVRTSAGARCKQSQEITSITKPKLRIRCPYLAVCAEDVSFLFAVKVEMTRSTNDPHPSRTLLGVVHEPPLQPHCRFADLPEVLLLSAAAAADPLQGPARGWRRISRPWLWHLRCAMAAKCLGLYVEVTRVKRELDESGFVLK